MKAGAVLAPRIVVVGSANIDLMLLVPRWPRPGETVNGRDFAVAPGGKGANQAVAAARLGGSVTFVGCVGDDTFGAQCVSALHDNHVDTSHVHVLRGAATGVAMVLCDEAGENSIALAPGANHLLSRVHVDAAADAIEQADLMVCQLESPLDVILHALRLAQRKNVATLLNPAPARPLADDALKGLRFLVANATEAELMSGIEVVCPASAALAARALLNKGVATVLLTLGAAGAVVADADGITHLPAPPAKAIDTTGAGDTFIGAFSSVWSRSGSTMEAVRYAQIAAAFSVEGRGAQASMPWSSQLSMSASD